MVCVSRRLRQASSIETICEDWQAPFSLQPRSRLPAYTQPVYHDAAPCREHPAIPSARIAGCCCKAVAFSPLSSLCHLGVSWRALSKLFVQTNGSVNSAASEEPFACCNNCAQLSYSFSSSVSLFAADNRTAAGKLARDISGRAEARAEG